VRPACLKSSRKLFGRLFAVAVIAGCAAALYGCSAPAPVDRPAAPVAVSDAGESRETAAMLAPIVQPLDIGPSGAMGLKAAGPFMVEAVRAAFGGLETVAGQTAIDRRVVPIIQVRSDGLALYDIYAAPGGRMIGLVVTRSPAVAGPRNEVIGSTRQRDLPAALVTACTVETGSGEQRQVCPDPDEPRFVRVFRPQQDADVVGEGAGRLGALAGGDVLMEMRWSPPAS